VLLRPSICNDTECDLPSSPAPFFLFSGFFRVHVAEAQTQDLETILLLKILFRDLIGVKYGL
jgi:hypothetical protein